MPKRQTEKYSEVIISHPGSDFDSIASMWAAHLLYPNRPIVRIAGVDSNVREFMALYENEFPSLRLKDLDISAVKHLTIVDCSSRSQLSRIEGLLDRENVYIEMWDHHREKGPDFKVDSFHFERVGANTTLLVPELIRRGITLSPEEATLLLLGIYEDTGSLRFPTTTPDDLDAASWLLKTGASLDIVDKFLTIKLTPAQKELLTTLGLNVQIAEVRGLPIHITQAVVTEFIDEVAFLVMKVQETENADVIFGLVQLHDRVFIVGRSRLPSVNVGQILSIFGGGGHAQAASCLLTGTNHSVAMQRLLDAIREQVKPTVLARDIMSEHVKTIEPDSSIELAHKIIAHTGYSGLVVIGEDEKIVGIITRSDVDKAVEHGLGHAPVKGYMKRDPVTLREESSLGEIQNTIIENRIGFLPVIFGGNVSGVITRSDVLNALHSMKGGPEVQHEREVKRHPEEYGKELLSRLPSSHLDLLAVAGEVADHMGVSCYLVGGIVRDLVLSRRNIDIDLLVEGNGIEFAHFMAEKLNARVIENPRFRTAKIVLDDGFHIDVATARDEFYIRPGALPEVEAAGIRDDLVRRDFTINTLAIHINTRKWGYLIDYFGGMEDISNGLIRVLHTFSFVDDPTRILRALRFSERFGFELESQTGELLRRALLEGRLDDVSPERVRDELLLCIREDCPWPVIERIFDDGVFGILHQAIYSPMNLINPDDPVKPALKWLGQFISEEELPEAEISYMALLLAGTVPEDAAAFVKRFKYSRAVLQLAAALPNVRRVWEMLDEKVEKTSELAVAIESIPVPFWVVIVASTKEDSKRRENLRKYLSELRGVKAVVDGNDFIKEGFEPGPGFGKALDAIRRAKMDGEISSREEEIELAREILAGE